MNLANLGFRHILVMFVGGAIPVVLDAFDAPAFTWHAVAASLGVAATVGLAAAFKSFIAPQGGGQ